MMVDPRVELLERVLGVITLLAAGLLIPFGICVIYSLFKRRWREALLQTAIPVTTIAALALAFLGLDAWERSTYSARAYDVDADIEDSLYRYSTPPAFGGGYHFEVYAMPEAIRRRFASPDERLLSHFPKWKPGPDRRLQHWTRAPIAAELQEAVDVALKHGYPREIPELLPFVADAQDALTRPDAFFALCATGSAQYYGPSFESIVLYVADLRSGRIYVISDYN